LGLSGANSHPVTLPLSALVDAGGGTIPARKAGTNRPKAEVPQGVTAGSAARAVRSRRKVRPAPAGVARRDCTAAAHCRIPAPYVSIGASRPSFRPRVRSKFQCATWAGWSWVGCVLLAALP
jgi:hypothetical protein